MNIEYYSFGKIVMRRENIHCRSDSLPREGLFPMVEKRRPQTPYRRSDRRDHGKTGSPHNRDRLLRPHVSPGRDNLSP